MSDVKRYANWCHFSHGHRLVESHVGPYVSHEDYAALEAENAKLREENELREEAMHRLRDWTRAYPLSVFPEPDMKRVHGVLEMAGITLDSVSASNMRHVLKGVESILSETWESIRALKSPSSGGEK